MHTYEMHNRWDQQECDQITAHRRPSAFDDEPRVIVQVADTSADAPAAQPVAMLPVGLGCGSGDPDSDAPVCAAQLDGSLLLAGPCGSGKGSSVCIMAITAASGEY